MRIYLYKITQYLLKYLFRHARKRKLYTLYIYDINLLCLYILYRELLFNNKYYIHRCELNRCLYSNNFLKSRNIVLHELYRFCSISIILDNCSWSTIFRKEKCCQYL